MRSTNNQSVNPDMIDAIFDVSGEMPAATYPFDLWKALVRHAPDLDNDDSIGVIPLRGSSSASGMSLPKRAKLTLRLPSSLAGHADQLSGRQLALDGGTLQLGTHKLRPIQAYPTLHAHLVCTDEAEVDFIKSVTTRLNELGVVGNLICGLRNHITSPARTLQGYSLVVHDLKPDSSLRLQYLGLGTDRRYGCGIFVPYKAITDLDS